MDDPTGAAPPGGVAAKTESVRLITVPAADPGPAAAAPAQPPRWLIATGFGSLVATVVFLTFGRLFEPDTYLALYAGRFVSAHGIPFTDPFTVAAHGNKWIDQQWLAQWLFFESWRIGGDAAPGVLSGTLIALAFGILAMTIMRRGIDPTRAVIWSTFAFFVCLLNMVTRTQSFAYPCYAAMLWIMLEDERRERYHWSMLLGLPILVIWANVHGSALMGAGIATAWCIYRAILVRARRDTHSSDRYLATAFAFAASVLIISPYSPANLIHYYRSVLQNPELTKYVAEWRPASFTGINIEFLVLLALVLVTVSFAYGRGKRPSLPLVVLTGVTALGGIHALRLQLWFAFPAVILMADVLEQLAPSTGGGLLSRRWFKPVAVAAVALLVVSGGLAFGADAVLRMQVAFLFLGFLGAVMVGVTGGYAAPRLRWVLIGATCVPLVCALVVLAMTPASRFNAATPQKSLAAAEAYAAAHPGTDILGDDITNPALLWHYPQLNGRIGYDTRFEIFTKAQLMPYLHYIAMDTPSWAAATKGYQVLVVSKNENPKLAQRVAQLPGWHLIQSDKDGLVAVRSAG